MSATFDFPTASRTPPTRTRSSSRTSRATPTSSSTQPRTRSESTIDSAARQATRTTTRFRTASSSPCRRRTSSSRSIRSTERIVARYAAAGVRSSARVHARRAGPTRLRHVRGKWNDCRSSTSGRCSVLATLSVARRPGRAGVGPAWRRLYVAAESGVRVQRSGSTARRSAARRVSERRHAHTVSVDPRTHRVYLPLENVDGHPVLRILEPNPSPRR